MDDGRVDGETGGADALANADNLILVDEADREVGYLSKARCHDGRGVRQRPAFAAAIYGAAGQQRQNGRPARRGQRAETTTTRPFSHERCGRPSA